MRAPERGRAVAGLRGDAAACLLWLLLLWHWDPGCRAQRAGCKTVHYDLVFLLDTSSSVGKEDFEKVRQWVANLVDTFEVGPDRTRVGVVRYSDQPTTAFELGLFGSREAVKAAARHLAYHGGNTNTGDALRFITRHSFSPQAGGRPGDHAFKQVAILLTDGRSQDLVLDAAAAAHRAGIRIFAVGVGEALKEELEEIASEPKSAHVFHVSDFNAIDKIRGKLRRRLCENVLCPSVRVEGDRFKHTNGETKEITGFDLMDLFSVKEILGRRENGMQSSYVRMGSFPVVQRTE
ncbi:collagen alpha-1(XXII) chain-like [Leptonychotes weddellii]|uniref:Collagen alpha-1(XXII) chain-like n=2 Tax=Monachinae TaxID=3410119 RepID=A0A7F8RCB8_LEPWE|nr:collagen alpha-1(XXII) chain-like [Leptonychotes weddellii]